MTGKVKSYGPKYGYGFIEAENGEIFFFHHTEWKLPIKPQEKLIVEFEPADSERGRLAKNIKRAERRS